MYVGFQNNFKENSCYVNVVFQTLFHLPELRDRLIDEDFHMNLNISISINLLYELSKTLEIYKSYSLEKVISIRNRVKAINTVKFRQLLADEFSDIKAYEFNSVGDPVELLNHLLLGLHTYLVDRNKVLVFTNDPPDCKPLCIIHQLFQISLIERNECFRCLSNKQIKEIVYDNNLFIFEFHIKEIIRYCKEHKLQFNNIKEKILIISAKTRESGLIKCEKCKGNLSKILECTNVGKYLIFNCAWTNDNKIKMQHIVQVYYMIPLIMSLSDIYKCEEKDNKQYELFGLILFWNHHYVCVFKENDKWVYYDDLNITIIDNWEGVVDFTIKNNFRPVAIFYTHTESNQSNSLFISSKLTEDSYNKEINFWNEKMIRKNKASISIEKERESKCIRCLKGIKSQGYCSECIKINKRENLIKDNENNDQQQKYSFSFSKTNDFTSKYVCSLSCKESNDVDSDYTHCKKDIVGNKETGINTEAIKKKLKKMTMKKDNDNDNDSKSFTLFSKEEKNIDKSNQNKINPNYIETTIQKIQCPHCQASNYQFSTYCSKCYRHMNLGQTSDKEKKNLHRYSNNNKQIKENEWICNRCETINYITNPLCKSCKIENEVIFDMISQQHQYQNHLQEENKQVTNNNLQLTQNNSSYNNKDQLQSKNNNNTLKNKQNEIPNDEIWICDICKASNMYSTFICKCSTINYVIKDLIEQRIQEEEKIINQQQRQHQLQQQHQKRSVSSHSKEFNFNTYSLQKKLNNAEILSKNIKIDDCVYCRQGLKSNCICNNKKRICICCLNSKFVTDGYCDECYAKLLQKREIEQNQNINRLHLNSNNNYIDNNNYNNYRYHDNSFLSNGKRPEYNPNLLYNYRIQSEKKPITIVSNNNLQPNRNLHLIPQYSFQKPKYVYERPRSQISHLYRR